MFRETLAVPFSNLRDEFDAETIERLTAAYEAALTAARLHKPATRLDHEARLRIVHDLLREAREGRVASEHLRIIALASIAF